MRKCQNTWEFVANVIYFVSVGGIQLSYESGSSSWHYRPIRSEFDSSTTQCHSQRILSWRSGLKLRRITLHSHTNTWCWFGLGSQTDGMIHVWYMNCSFSVSQTRLSCRTNDDLLFLCRQLSTNSNSHNYYLKLRLLYSAYGTIIASLQHHYGIITWIMVLSISGIESLLVEPLATLHLGSAGKWALLPCFQQTIMESGSKGRIWFAASEV